MRRSPLRRSTGISHTEIKPKVCKNPACGKCFIPLRPMQDVCSPRCAAAKVRADKKAEREETKRRKEAMKTIHDLIREADRAFSAFIRERDRQAGHPCISSGKPLDWSGNQVDAGHYRSRGAASHLRYDEDNCHGQSKQENQWKAGNIVSYRVNLIERIGFERVEALEAKNDPHKWERDELIQIAATYKAKLKELKQRTEA